MCSACMRRSSLWLSLRKPRALLPGPMGMSLARTLALRRYTASLHYLLSDEDEYSWQETDE